MIKNNDKKRNDLFLGAVLFLAAAVLFLGQHVFREKGAAIQVLVKDEEFGTYPLSEDQEIPIGEGDLVISGGEAFMKWAGLSGQALHPPGRSPIRGKPSPVFPTG